MPRQDDAHQLGLGFSRQSDRQRRLRRAAGDRADQFRRTAPAGVAAKIVAIAEAKTRATRFSASPASSPCSSRPSYAIGWSASPSCGDDHLVDHRQDRLRLHAGFIFFAQGFEHSVVNMFIIPTGMMMGAKVTIAQWWLWN